jgi:hypothetical protein
MVAGADAELAELKAAREKELLGQSVDTAHHEAVIYLKYLEEYMRGIRESRLSKEYVAAQLYDSIPREFIVARFVAESKAMKPKLKLGRGRDKVHISEGQCSQHSDDL